MMARVTIQLTGPLRRAAGREELELEVGAGTSVADAIVAAAAGQGELFRATVLGSGGRPSGSLMVLVNEEVCGKPESRAAADGDVVTLIAAISGG